MYRDPYWDLYHPRTSGPCPYPACSFSSLVTWSAIVCLTLETFWTLKILMIFSWDCLCAFLMVLWLHCLLVRLTVFWMILLELVGFWWDVCSSPQAELGPPGGVTYSCLGERSSWKNPKCSLHCWRREEWLTVW